MLKNLKLPFQLSLFIWLSLFSIHAFSEQGNSLRTKDIVGHPPYINSIGAIATQSDVDLYDKDDQPVLTVGTLLSIPSSLCEIGDEEDRKSSPDTYLFDFIDHDGDLCLAKEAHQLSWYILDNGKTDWNTISAWQELQAKEITEINEPGSIIPPLSNNNPNLTSNLIIPKSAVNKRLGFIYTPISSTGYPNKGAPIKVWDLNYLFGQNPMNKPQLVPEPNDGHKLSPSPIFSGGGVVMDEIAPLQLTELFISGDFMKSAKLTLNYTISHPTWSQFEDISRFWWGKNDTLKEAYFQNPNYSNSPNSFELTQEHIGQSLEVSILPIIQSNLKRKLVGTPEVITTDDNNNQLTYPPIISELQITSLGNVGETLNATYTFTKVGNTQEGDASQYKWELVNLNGTTEELFSGTISQSGIISSGIEIQKAWQGKKVKLTITAFDTKNRQGNTLTSELNISNVNPPTISNLTFLDDGFVGFNLLASYTFDFEDVANDKDQSEYQWFFEYQDGQDTLVSSGTVQSTGNIPASPVITDNMLGRKITLSVLPKVASGLSGQKVSISTNSKAPNFYNLSYEIVANNAVAGMESNIIKLKVAEILTGVPVSNIPVKTTSNNSNIIISSPQTVTDYNGEFVANISKNTSGAATININFEVGHSSISVPVNFILASKSFNGITANNFNFAINSGFPETAFNYAKFKLLVDNPLNYTWTSSNTNVLWVDTVGNVTVSGRNNFDTVTITASNQQDTLTYYFKPKYWFSPVELKTYADAEQFCLNSGARLPIKTELSHGQGVRSVGSFWGEWANDVGWSHTYNYWTQSMISPGITNQVFTVNMYNGDNTEAQFITNPNLKFYTACVFDQ